MSPVVRIALSIALAAGVAWLAPPPLRTALALFALTGALWITQALPLPVTALLVPLAAATSGLLTPREALAAFAHPVIFLFLGGFALAAALARQGLDVAMAAAVLRLARGRRLAAALWLAAGAAGLSMWISNTATVAMMLPLALGLLRADPGRDGAQPGPREKAFVLLALAYSGAIGGVATLVGSPPNAIAAAAAGIDFLQWIRIGLPLAAVAWPLMLGLLWLLLRPRLGGCVAVPAGAPGWNRDRVLTLAIFAATVGGWLGGEALGRAFGIAADIDSLVALAAIVALGATGLLDWKRFEQGTPWGVLLLFGGGLALSAVMGSSGASRFLAEGVLARFGEAPAWALVLGVVAFVVFLTELVSNTASAALLVPVLMPIAGSMGLSAQAVAMAVAIAASCAFMLPVATPPNALIFATDEVPQATMMRCGFWLNLMCIGLIAGAATAGLL